MSQLIRLVYASRSTIESSEKQQGLDPGVARILAKSRRNNARLQIAGGLLFGEGYFLQCLEGEADVVNSLYAKIAADLRHRDVTVLAKTSIPVRSFGAWSMKYVPGEQRLQALLQRWGLERFDPYRLSAEQLDVAVHFMQREVDSAETLPEETSAVAPAQTERAHRPVVSSRPAGVVGKLSPTDRPENATTKRSVVWMGVAGAFVACAAMLAYLLSR